MAELVKTDDLLTADQLRDVFGEEDSPEPDASPIAVCAGEWRYEDGKWRFWIDPNLDDDENV